MLTHVEEHSIHQQVFIQYPLTCLKLTLGMEGPEMQESLVTSSGVLETGQHMLGTFFIHLYCGP